MPTETKSHELSKCVGPNSRIALFDCSGDREIHGDILASGNRRSAISSGHRSLGPIELGGQLRLAPSILRPIPGLAHTQRSTMGHI